MSQNVSISILKPFSKYGDFLELGDCSGLKESIQKQGIISDIIVSPDLTVLDGHKRVAIASELGYTLVPVQIKEDVISDDDKLNFFLSINLGKSPKIDTAYYKPCDSDSNNDDVNDDLEDEHMQYIIDTYLGGGTFKNSTSKSHSVYIKDCHWEKIQQLANEYHLSCSNVLSQILEEVLK